MLPSTVATSSCSARSGWSCSRAWRRSAASGSEQAPGRGVDDQEPPGEVGHDDPVLGRLQDGAHRVAGAAGPVLELGVLHGQRDGRRDLLQPGQVGRAQPAVGPQRDEREHPQARGEGGRERHRHGAAPRQQLGERRIGRPVGRREALQMLGELGPEHAPPGRHGRPPDPEHPARHAVDGRAERALVVGGGEGMGAHVVLARLVGAHPDDREVDREGRTQALGHRLQRPGEAGVRRRGLGPLGEGAGDGVGHPREPLNRHGGPRSSRRTGRRSAGCAPPAPGPRAG